MAFTDHKLRFTIDADGKAARQELLNIDSMIGKVGSGLGGWAGPAAVAATAFAAVGGAAVGAGIALFNLTKNAADYGSEIFDASKKTGLHAEALSAMDFAAKQSGASMEQITGGIAKFSKTVGEAADGSDKAADKLKAFGISPQEALNDLEGALGKVFQRIIAAPEGIQRMTLAQKAFGKSGADLLPFIDSFDGDLGKLIKTAKDLGVTIDDKTAKAADNFGDQLDTLSAQLGAAGRAIAGPFMGPFTDMAKDVSDWLATNKDAWTAWGDSAAGALQRTVREAKITAKWFDDNPNLTEFLRQFAGVALLGPGYAGGNLLSGPGAEKSSATGGWFGKSINGASPSLPPSLGGGGGGGGSRRGASSGDDRTDKQVYQAFVSELKKLGVTINSGYRTYAQQASLYARLPKGQAARPGTSDHEFYKAVDLPAGVSQTILEKAARAAGVTLDKRNVHEGTGLHNHQGFQKGKFKGGGEATAYSEAVAAREELAEWDRLEREGLRELADEWIAAEQHASESRLSIRQKEAEQAEIIIEGMVQSGEMTEREGVQRIGQLRLDMLREEQTELEGQVPTIQNIQRLEELRLEIGTQELKNINEEHGYWKKITDEINKQNASLQKRNQRPGLEKRESYQERIERMGAITPGSGQEISAMGQLHDYFVSEGNTAAIAGVDALAQAFGGLGQAIGATVEAWVLYGAVGEGAQEVTAKILASIAQQAAIKAIFELAEGFAMLGLAFFGHPGAGPSATQHFIAAGVYAGIAGGAAIAGRVVAGDSMKQGGSKSSGGGSSSGSGQQQRDTTPYSRVTDDAYTSGHRNTVFENLTAEIRELRKMVQTASPGDVLVRGSQQRKGFIGTQAVDDMKTRPQLGTRMLRQANAR